MGSLEQSKYAKILITSERTEQQTREVISSFEETLISVWVKDTAGFPPDSVQQRLRNT